MAVDGYYISRDDWPDFADLLRAWRRGEIPGRHGPLGERRTFASSPRVVVLHGPLEFGHRVMAELLVPAAEEEDVFDLELVGWPGDAILAGEPFTVPVFGEVAPLQVSILDTAADLRKKLRATKIKDFVIDVTLGRHPEAPPGVSPFRWRVHLAKERKKYPSTNEPFLPFPTHVPNAGGYLTAANSWPVPWVGTGQLIEVASALPTGEPPSLRQGAQCIVQRISGVWCVIAGEVRRLNTGFPGWLLP